MDISCIISSGDIELYVLGLLSPEDARKMEQLILLFPEIKKEADYISEVLQKTATAGEAMPSPKVREKLFTELPDVKEKNDNPVIGVTENTKRPSFPAVVPFTKRYPSALIAASLIALVSIIGVIYAISKNLTQEKELAALHLQVNQKEKENSQQSLAYEQVIQVIKDYKQIDLDNVPGKPESLAKIFWHPQTSQVYLMDISLPSPPTGKQYQLWAIVDGKPLSAGMVLETKNQLQKMQNFSKAEAFAITLEPSGGSVSPTLEEMYVLGKNS